VINEPKIDFQNDRKAAELIESDNLFAVDLFREVLSADTSKNLMISPLSVSIALGMTYNGAEGETKTAFEEALRQTGLDRHDINRIHGALIEHLISADPKVSMEIANSIWVNDLFTLMQEFADTNRIYYDAEINSLDFSSPDAVNTINNWIDDKTQGKISEVLDEIPPAAVMYLINAIYYYGSWTFEFDEKDNQPINFLFENATRGEVEGMQMEADLGYYSDDLLSMVELPYGNEKYSMVLMLPNTGKTTADIVDNFSLENWNLWTENLSSNTVRVHIPKFKFEYKTLLNKALTEMGLGRAFSGSAQFPLMVEEADNLRISRVIHKTFIDVNEEGTEAAAVTVVEIELTSVGPDQTKYFTADRPFLFVIREKTSGALVFMGKVSQPSYN